MAREKIKLTSYDELLGVSDGTKDIELDKLSNFKNHPFKVIEDDKMEDLVKSITENGVLSPILVREAESGRYEIISGHRRKRASELAGLKTIPAIVKNVDDDEAIILMVDSNIQREEILPSEKAFAFKMKMDALKNKGKDMTVFENAKEISEEDNISVRQLFRYLSLTNLIPELLDMVDTKEIAMILAIDISQMSKDIQFAIYEQLQEGKKINKDDIAFIKRNPETITKEDVKDLLDQENEQNVKKINVTLKQNRLSEYFPPEYSKKEMEDVIYSLLEKWKEDRD
jgi:ParB family chromosome partitioning protein